MLKKIQQLLEQIMEVGDAPDINLELLSLR